MRCSLKKLLLATREQRGFTLLETLIALALLGIFVGVFLSSVSTASVTMANAEVKVNLDNLARAQMEYTKNAPYIYYIYGTPDVPPDYVTLDELAPSDPYAIVVPSGYAINVSAVALNEPDDGIQRITVTISRDGQDLLVLFSNKVAR